MVLKNRIPAFSLVETMLAMMICCALILIPGINYHQQLMQEQEKLALDQFENNWSIYLKRSFLTESMYRIELIPQNNTISFFDSRLNHKVIQKMPKYLHVYSHKVITVNRDGSTKPTSLILYSSLNKRKYTYQVQMEWGQLIAS